jgi:hypothetical protein
MSDFNYIEYLKNNPLLKKSTNKLITESQETLKSSKVKKSELKAKIREEILSTLNEEEDYERMSREVEYGIGGPDTSNYDEEIDMEDLFADLEGDFEDMPIDFEPIDEAKEDEEEAPEEEEMDAGIDVDVETAPTQGLSAEEQEIQNNLKIAYDNAVAIGDQKLADQIGNSITFFTRTHVVER